MNDFVSNLPPSKLNSEPQKNQEQTKASPADTKTAEKVTGPSRKLLISLIATFVVVALGLFGLFWIQNYKKVPELVGMTAGEAIQELRDANLAEEIGTTGIEMTVGEEHFTVLKQSPEPGTFLKNNSQVTIYIEAQLGTVPDLEGLTLNEAKLAAEKSHFLFTAIPDRDLDSSWKVLSQATKSGTEAPKGTVIEVTADLPTVTVPDTIGKTASEGAEILEETYLDTALIGTGDVIVRTKPAATESVQAFETVELVMGVKFPDLTTSFRPNSALTALADKGFTSVLIEGPENGYITGISIAADTVVTLDTPVVISAAPSGTTYRISGNGSSALITYAAPGSYSIQQETSATLPWEKFFEGRTGTAVFNAQSMDGDSITCTLLRDGKEVKTLTSTGTYAIVQC